ncbi:MAG: hypothetical protein JW820_00330 [Spirochaetales bacterium]|nr:hypothetical protein [Spirochaetales bacterium]
MPKKLDSSPRGRGLPFPIVTLVLLAFLAAPAAQAQDSALDKGIAEGYLRQAEALFRSGDDRHVLELLERSLEFYPDFSESLYLRGLVLMKRQDTLEAAREALERALDAGSWISTPPQQAQLELARLHVRTRRYAAARRLLESLAPDRGLGGVGSSVLAELWARVLIGEGRFGEAEALLERALRRYPDAPRLYALAGELLGGTLPAVGLAAGAGEPPRAQRREAVEVLDRGLGELPGTPELILARARVESQPDVRIGLLEGYLDRGGRDPGAAALLLVDLLEALAAEDAPDSAVDGAAAPGAGEGGAGTGTSLPEDPPGSGRAALAARAERALERFVELGGAREIPLVDGLRGYLQPGGEGLHERLLAGLEASLAGYTGAGIVDADRDGLYEERYEYEGGALKVWTLDADQNGLPEARAEYGAEGLSRLEFPSSPVRVEYLYSRYPYLGEVAFVDAGGRRVYELVPFRHAADVVERASAARSGVLSGWTPGPRLPAAPTPAAPTPPAPDAAQSSDSAVPDHPLGRRLRPADLLVESQARARASRMTEYLPGEPPGGAAGQTADRVHLLLNGQTLRIDARPDRSGRYRHRVVYEEGRPVYGLRDLDEDGRFETREEYRGGELALIELDQDGDGNPEFTELLDPDPQARSEKRWDYDSDGRVDSRQRQLRDGSTVREFSSRLDGSFDLRAVFRDGRLAEFRRGGEELSVRYDSSRGVYWIGRVRAWDRLPQPLTEGVHHRGGSRVFVFEHGDDFYIIGENE